MGNTKSSLWARAVWSLSGPLLVFVVLGPPIGGVTFICTTALWGMGTSSSAEGMFWVALFAMIYGVPLSYLVGALPAALVGLVVGTARYRLGCAPWWLIAAAGGAAGLWTYAAGGAPFPPSIEAGSSALGLLLVLLATCLVPALVCGAIVRR